MTFPIRIGLTLVLLLASSEGRVNAQSRSAASPHIFFEQSPALLITIDGDPVYRPIEGTDLERIINTRALIVREPAGIHYLKVLDGWMESYTLTSGWSPSGVRTPGGAEALERALGGKSDGLRDGVGSPVAAVSLATQVPTIVVSPEPAALIVTDGPARYQKVGDTSLEHLVNTTAKVFREPTDQELYILVGGRWFRAWTTDGPWEFIPDDELPADITAWISKTP